MQMLYDHQQFLAQVVVPAIVVQWAWAAVVENDLR